MEHPDAAVYLDHAGEHSAQLGDVIQVAECAHLRGSIWTRKRA
jgi:hypothetical protein